MSAVLETAMVRKIIRADGREERLDGPHAMRSLQHLIAGNGIDVVQLRHLGRPVWVMIVDDTGFIDGRPINEKATALYHANCHPGTTHPICGDVAILLDEDFA